MDKGNKEKLKTSPSSEQKLSMWDGIKILSICGVVCSALAIISWFLSHNGGLTSLSFISLNSFSIYAGTLGFILGTVALLIHKRSKDPAGVVRISVVALGFSLALPVFAIFPNGLLG